MSGFFYKLGRLVGPKFRQARWVYDSLTGSAADAIRAEYEVGRDLARSFVQQTEVEHHPALGPLLDDVGARLTAHPAARPRRFCFRLVKSPEPNAYALPGGFVFVTRPLLELCNTDPDEIAFVLGHEMAHVIQQHAIERMMANTVISAALSRLSLGRGGLLGGPATGLMTALLNQGYSQDQELEADRVGVRLAASAGFDPRAATRLLQRLASLTADSTLLGSYFSSHPPHPLRIERVNRCLAGA